MSASTPDTRPLQAKLVALKDRGFQTLSPSDEHWSANPPKNQVKLDFHNKESAANFRDVVQERADELSRIYGKPVLNIKHPDFFLDELCDRILDPAQSTAPYTLTIRETPSYPYYQKDRPYQTILTLDVLNLIFGPEFARQTASSVLKDEAYDAQKLWHSLSPVAEEPTNPSLILTSVPEATHERGKPHSDKHEKATRKPRSSRQDPRQTVLPLHEEPSALR